jgi:hypothetical protein
VSREERHDTIDVIEIRPPRSGAELVAELRRVAGICDAFWNRFPTHEFFAPIGTAWSPAENIRHLVKSTRPVATALRLPRIALLALFGPATRGSRTLEALVDDYRGVLAAGGRAGRFAPRPLRGDSDPGVVRERLMSDKRTADAMLSARAEAWSESALDRCRLPHPLLGKITLREMLFFTLHHGVHHVANVERRKRATM